MPKVTFNNKDHLFFNDLKQAVDAYFNDNKLRKTGNWVLYSKALVLITAAILLYTVLLTVNYPVWLGLVYCAILGMVLASIGFNVMHDACHGSYSSKNG